MTLVEILILLVIAGVCGGVAQALGGYSRGGCLVSIALGFIGAFLGVMISRWIGWSDILTIQLGDVRFPIIWSIIGATLFVLLLRLLRGRPRYYDRR
jgi:uncharacterized membrane protein YeaQ/YmgE (transglycosylase-associated protein family)